MHLAIMKDCIVNAITKANVLNKVNDAVYDNSLLVTDKLQKPKKFHTSHIWVYPIPDKYSAVRLAPDSKSITTDYLTSSESTTFILLIVKHQQEQDTGRT
jgi:hypothetical protein